MIRQALQGTPAQPPQAAPQGTPQGQGLNPQDAMSLLNAVHDEGTYQQAKAIAVHLSPDLGNALPPHYDPQVIDGFKQQIMQEFPDIAKQMQQLQAPQQQSAAPAPINSRHPPVHGKLAHAMKGKK